METIALELTVAEAR